MRRTVGRIALLLLLAVAGAGCGHTQTCKVGLLSFGNLEGRSFPVNPKGPVVVGSSACNIGGMNYYLSDALRDALKNTGCDTLIDAEVIAETGLFVPMNKITVKGTAVNSSSLTAGGAQ